MSDEYSTVNGAKTHRSDNYGYTCDECPSRGSYDIVGGFVGIDSIADSRVKKFLTIGYPDRCKKCNANSQRATSAKEAIKRCEIIRKVLVDNSYSNKNYNFLKFVTLTFPREWTRDNQPPVDAFLEKIKSVRMKLMERFDIVGGTDVIENVVNTRLIEDETWYHHHLHTHGVWLAPYIPIDELREFMTEIGVGRFKFEVIEPKSYQCKYTDEWKIQTAERRACSYLAKYMSKETLVGRRRIAWGNLRQWKQYVDEPICHRCVKTTTQIEDYQNCNCKFNQLRAGNIT